MKTLTGPLAGIKVLDMTSIFMGPYATQMLGDLGADVIKVEAMQGDSVRGVGPCGEEHLGPLFLGLNRNKRSIVLDLKSATGHAAILRLVEKADVLAYNLRPQAMQRLGLEYEVLREINPRLVYVGMFGFSQRGRYASKPAFDDLIQAATGLAMANATPDGKPHYVPATVADRSVGLYAFGVICAALMARERTGEGQRVDIPMFEAMTSNVMGDHLYGETFVPHKGGTGYPRLLSEHRRPYETLDGYLCCVIYTDNQWRAFLALQGKAVLFESDPRFQTIHERTKNIDFLYGLVAQEMRTRTNAQWVAMLQEADIPFFPVNTFDTLLQDAHLDDIRFFSEVEQPGIGTIRQMAVPSEWHGTTLPPTRPAPVLGEHSREVLREAGYSDAEIDAMLQAGITRDSRR
ncbi:CaiB/BaiF CoA transferase family protein [Achromobacter piechaudii]|uniref:Formyl-CoA:oxalate CoA-transferase n=1 Tax=Achromobacter piechaudii TaxID=72556 RepID=A0A6S7CWN4_9BURK|nr:CoA transferase [Achromobacter piechaudii]CAB3868068.1 Formyl-CoA:oxalate CoA-transferase [Achromobacter piechaudii]